MAHISGTAADTSRSAPVDDAALIGRDRNAERIGRCNSHEQSARSRTFAVAYLLSGIGSFLAVLAVNFLGNGSRLYPSPFVSSGTDREWKSHRLEELVTNGDSPDVLVIGSSRVMQIEPNYVELVTGRRTFNFGVSDATPLDYLVQLRFALRCGAKPKMIILGIDEFKCGDLTENADLRTATHWGLFAEVPFPENVGIVADLVKGSTIRTTARSLRNLMVRRSRARRCVADVDSILLGDGYLVYAERVRAKIRGDYNLQEEVRQMAARFKTQFSEPGAVAACRPNHRRLGFVREFLRVCKMQRIEVYAVLLPLHPALEKEVMTPELLDVRNEVRTRVMQMCVEHGASFRDFTSLEAYGGTPEDFWDGVHQTPANTRRMVNAALNIDPSTLTARLQTDAEVLANLPPVTTLTTE